MDWYIIEYLYPKSYKKFISTMFPNIGIISTHSLLYFDIKKLYSFFDKEKIYLIIEMDNNRWSFILKINNWIISPCNYNKLTRESVEDDGFYYCFEQLEKKLNNN